MKRARFLLALLVVALCGGCGLLNAERIEVVGPVNYVGKRVGSFEVGEGGRVIIGGPPTTQPELEELDNGEPE